MDKEQFILNFNDPKLKFDVKSFSKYDTEAVYTNIDKFKKFMYGIVVDEKFDNIYKTIMFQLALNDPKTSYIENLVEIYNMIASEGLIKGKKYPTINGVNLSKQLRLKGYRIYYTRLRLAPGNYIRVRKVVKEKDAIWN